MEDGLPQQLSRRTLLRLGTGAALSACLSPWAASGSSGRVRPLDGWLDVDATGMAESVRSGEVTPLELVDLVIARIEALEGSINALTTRAFDRARERARKASATGPFAGVPFLVKDMVDVEGLPRTNGADERLTRVPKSSPAYVKALVASGLNVVAVTSVPEFGTIPATVSRRFGATANPWRLDRTPAGSSGGSAAAVAAGYVPLAHATDGAGSIRLPSSYCGVFGFKPSRGRTLPGEVDGRHDLIKHHHGISRTVRDSANLLAVSEDRGQGARYAPIGVVRGAAVRRLRIGVSSSGVRGERPDAAQSAALADARRLCAGLGHRVVEAPPLPIDGDVFWQYLESVFLSRMPVLVAAVEQITGQPFERTSLLSPFTMSFARRASGLPPDALESAKRYFGKVESAWLSYMADYDVLLSPVQPIVQPAIDVYDPNGSFDDQADSIRSFMAYTAVANATGAPAMSVPLHWTTEGLPLGAHFSARPGDDRTLLELAFELEGARPWKNRWPPHSIRALAREQT